VFDPDIVFLTYFDFCDHSRLTVNMISALKSLAYVAEILLIELFKSKYIKSKTRCRGLVHMGQKRVALLFMPTKMGRLASSDTKTCLFKHAAHIQSVLTQ